jgi:transposase-like protein
MPKFAAMAGRPLLLTDERLELFLAARRRGDSVRLAAEKAGVSKRTGQRWVLVARQRGLWDALLLERVPTTRLPTTQTRRQLRRLGHYWATPPTAKSAARCQFAAVCRENVNAPVRIRT